MASSTLSYLQKKTMEFDAEGFLRQYPDPARIFCDIDLRMSSSYKEHVRIYLYNKFSGMSDEFVDQVMEKHNHHLTRSYKDLREVFKIASSVPNYHKQNKPRPKHPLPAEPDEHFYNECMFVRHEVEIMAMLQAMGESIQSRLEMVEAVGVLEICTCCYHDKVIPEKIFKCPNGHSFCNECVQKGAEVAIGQGDTILECMSANCSTPFATAILREALKPQTMNLLLKMMEEMQASSTEEEQQKRSEADEVKKPHTEANMRTYIENHITTAMIRACYNCRKKFVKVDGCNMVECVCGAKMCYVCKKPIQSYNHFVKSYTCSVMNDTTLHTREMKKAAEEAKQKYMQQHPDAAAAAASFDLAELVPVPAGGLQNLMGPWQLDTRPIPRTLNNLQYYVGPRSLQPRPAPY